MTTRGWALDRVQNWPRPLDRLQYDSQSCVVMSSSNETAMHHAGPSRWETTQPQRDGAARLSRRDVMHFVTMWPWPLTFSPNINWWARYRDGLSLCQVWRFWFKPFWFYNADTQTESQPRMIAILTRLLSMSVMMLMRLLVSWVNTAAQQTSHEIKATNSWWHQLCPSSMSFYAKLLTHRRICGVVAQKQYSLLDFGDFLNKGQDRNRTKLQWKHAQK